MNRAQRRAQAKAKLSKGQVRIPDLSDEALATLLAQTETEIDNAKDEKEREFYNKNLLALDAESKKRKELKMKAKAAKAKEREDAGIPVVTNSPFFRPGTETTKRVNLFRLNNGGMGDYICWMAAILWIAKNYDFLSGQLICPNFFMPIAKNLLKDYPDWEVHSNIPPKYQDGYPIRAAHVHPINATMMHLLDLGFLYYAGVNPVPPEAKIYPRLDLANISIPELPEKYIVLTPGATAPTRAVPAEVFNKTVEHVINLGYTPVFLGKRVMDDGKRKIKMDENYDISGGIDLVDKTSLLEAAAIMSKAGCVVGLDNGLLHLAAMTDVPIVFAYTIAGPSQRRPYRKDAKLVELYVPYHELPCTFCQERVRFFMDHNFESCIYKDYKCIEMLSADFYNEGIDMALAADLVPTLTAPEEVDA